MHRILDFLKKKKKKTLRWFSSNAHIKHTFIVVILFYYAVLRPTCCYTTNQIRERQSWNNQSEDYS